MGNIHNCTSTCKVLSHIEELTEMTNDFQPTEYPNQENLKLSGFDSNIISLNNKMSVLDISKLIFNKINDMRFRPEEYLNEAKQRSCKSVFEQSINIIKNTGIRPMLFLWSDNKYNLLVNHDINSLCKNKYNHDDFFVSIDSGNINTLTSDDVIWKMLDNYDSEDQSLFFLKNYNHLVVSVAKTDKELNVIILFLSKDYE